MSDRTNPEWLTALRHPQADLALNDLRAILLRGLRYALAGRGVTEADLEDFTQDALLKVLAELASFRGEARFTTWAQKVAVRVALTELRRRRWRDVSLQDLMAQHEDSDFTPDVLTDHASDPGQVAVQTMMMEKVERMIAEELTDKQRLAMMAVMQGGMPLQEVAQRMGTNRNALYKMLHDARQRLQGRMMREGLSPDGLLAMFGAK
jgi:RNA polymerase sigma-70 factor (ECF subfamily)